MSRANAPLPPSSRPTSNVYTALAFISCLATFAALVFMLVWGRQVGAGLF